MLSNEAIKILLAHPFDQVDLPLPLRKTGKVRELFALSLSKHLIITTDRLSAFDRIIGALPYKGQVLNQLSAWWFKNTEDIVSNHLCGIPDPNAAIIERAQVFPIELIVRGYISGVTDTSLWKRYAMGERDIYGYIFPDGLQKNQRLPFPIITPTTKGGITGHDERLTCEEVVKNKLVTPKRWAAIQKAALALFERGQLLSKKAGLLLVDTKYEFGVTRDNKILLIDEIHTPDSSRFWCADTYLQRVEKGEEPENFDKEFIRLALIKAGYHGEGVVPTLSEEFWIAATHRYISIYEKITGLTFMPAEYPVKQRLIRLLPELQALQYEINT